MWKYKGWEVWVFIYIQKIPAMQSDNAGLNNEYVGQRNW